MDAECAARCTDTYRRIFDDVNREIGVPMFPGVADTLRRLHDQGCTLTIATSRGYKSVAEFMHTFALDDIITFIIAAEDVRHAKPDAEPVTKTLKHFRLTPADAVVIGDTHFDILMGRNAGCATIGVTTATVRAKASSMPVPTISWTPSPMSIRCCKGDVVFFKELELKKLES